MSVDEEGYCNAGCQTEAALRALYQRLAASQRPLPAEFARVLTANRMKLYE